MVEVKQVETPPLAAYVSKDRIVQLVHECFAQYAESCTWWVDENQVINPETDSRGIFTASQINGAAATVRLILGRIDAEV